MWIESTDLVGHWLVVTRQKGDYNSVDLTASSFSM